MKKIKMFLMLLAVAILLPTTILAEETKSEAYDNFITCVSTKDSICQLTENIELKTPIEISNNITIDLNGKSITPTASFTDSASQNALFVVLRGGSLTINDSVGTGKISVNDTTIYAAIKLTKTGELENGNIASVVVNGGTLEGYYYAITGNGSRHNTSITINNGTIKALEESVGLGVFHPQDGTVTINGGTLYGTTGIEMRSGTLVVNGGTITGNKDSLTVKASGSGSTTIGAGIAVSQHNTMLNINVTVNGGTIEGYTAINQSDPQKNTEKDPNSVSKVQLAINGGTFKAINGGTTSVYSENKTAFITGGTFNTDVTSYIKEGYEVTTSDKNYVVAKIPNETSIPVIETGKNDEVVEDVAVGVVGESKKIENILLESLDSSNITTTAKAEVALEIETLDTSKVEADLVKEMEAAAGKAKITSYFDITVAVRNFEDKTLIGTLPVLTEEIELMILLPEELKNTAKDINRIYYVVRKHIEEENSKIELLEAKLSEDGKYLVFKTDKFSTYALAYEDVAVEKVLPPKTYDNISTYFVIGLLSLMCLAGIGIINKRRISLINKI